MAHCENGGTLKRTFLNPVLQTRHSWNAESVQNNSCCGAVDLWSTYANLQAHVSQTHMCISTNKGGYIMSPHCERGSPKQSPQEQWSHGSGLFSRDNCFNLHIISDLVITHEAQYTIGFGGYLHLSGQVVVVCALAGGDNGPWHCYRPLCGVVMADSQQCLE